MKLKLILLPFILLLFLTNCTIQKRTVNKGYFVQWHFNKKPKKDNPQTNPQTQENFIVSQDLSQKEDSTLVQQGINVHQDAKDELPDISIEDKAQEFEKKDVKLNSSGLSVTKKMLESGKKIIQENKEKKDPRQKILITLWISLVITIVGFMLFGSALFNTSLSAFLLVGFGMFVFGGVISFFMLLLFFDYLHQQKQEKKLQTEKADKQPKNKPLPLVILIIGILLLLFALLFSS